MSEHELWNEIGDLHFQNGSYERACKAYSQALVFAETENGTPYINHALACEQLGRYKEAIEYYQRGIQRLADPAEQAGLLRKVGDTHLLLKEYPQALEAYEQADRLVMVPEVADLVVTPTQDDVPVADALEESDTALTMPASTSGMELLPFLEELTPWWFEGQALPDEEPPMSTAWLQEEFTYSDTVESRVFTEPLKWEYAAPYQGGAILAETPAKASVLADETEAEPDATLVIVDESETMTIAPDFSAEDVTIVEAVQYETVPEVPVVELSAEERASIKADIEKYKRVLEINPRNAFAWDALGGQYKALGQYEDALGAFQKAVSLDSSKAFYFHHLGLVYAAVGRHEDAIGAFERVVEIDPSHSLAHATLGGYFRRNGEEALAQTHIEKARALITTDENEYNQACMESICGNKDRSLELLEIALKNKQTYVNWARKDPDLDFVRTDPRFNSLLATYAIRAGV